MPARHGQEVLRRMREHPSEIYHRGKLVRDVTTEPGFRNGVRSLAALYDLQWQFPEEMLFDSPTTGHKVGRSFMVPHTKLELKSISVMMKRWSDYSMGMMGRSPDYLNRAISAYAGGAAFLSEQDPRFGDNVRRYHEYIREHDLCLTHTLIHPQANRGVGVAQQADPFLGARVKEERDDGIVIRGARMLATLPTADEIMVFPSTLLTSNPEDAPYAFGFAIPCSTKGLKFLCRETVDYDRHPYDHPLGAHFEEQDAVVIFDDVFVPWERVFLYRDVDRCNRAYAATGAVVHMSHQVLVRDIAKTEFLMGLASLMVDMIGVEKFQHIHEKLADIWVTLEALKAFLRAAEEDATLDAYGVMRPAWDPLDAARNFYPRTYGRLVQVIQQLGASGLVSMPTEADMSGPLKDDIRKYYQAARAEAVERIPLFRLAWDASMSAFATRQVLYEHYFFGDPVRMAGALINSHDRKAYMERVREFLLRSTHDAANSATEQEYDAALIETSARI
jgi:4-hydroxyphenylacetate 3-monooxygenase